MRLRLMLCGLVLCCGAASAQPGPSTETVEQALGIRLRLPEEPAKFQISAPVRSSEGATTLTALLLAGFDPRRPQLLTVEFIRTKGPLVTITKGTSGGLAWLAQQCDGCVPAGSSDAFLVLLDLIIECATDLLDHVGDDLDRVNRALFQHHESPYLPLYGKGVGWRSSVDKVQEVLNI